MCILIIDHGTETAQIARDLHTLVTEVDVVHKHCPVISILDAKVTIQK